MKNIPLFKILKTNEISTSHLNCIYGEQLVAIRGGSSLRIRDIVNKKLSPEVLSYNLKDKKFEYKNITGWYKSQLGERKYLRINFKNSKKTYNNHQYKKAGVWLTNDHEILTPNGYIKTVDLKNGDMIATSINFLNYRMNENLIQNCEAYFDEIEINTKFAPSNTKAVFCIDVEDNHNFIVSNIIVHNCTKNTIKEIIN